MATITITATGVTIPAANQADITNALQALLNSYKVDTGNAPVTVAYS